MARTKRATPAELTPGWPETPSPDQIAEVARRFTLNFEANRRDRSLRQIAADAGLSHSVLATVLAGQSWPDMATIAKIERAVGAPLWPQFD